MSKFFVKNSNNSIKVECTSSTKIDKTIFFASNDENAEIYNKFDWKSMDNDSVIRTLNELGVLKEQDLKYDGYFNNLSKEDVLYNSKIDEEKDKRNHLINVMDIDTTKPYFNAMTNYCSGCCENLAEAEAYFSSIGFKFKDVFEKFKSEQSSFSLKDFNKYYNEVYENNMFDLIIEDKFIDHIKSESVKRKNEVNSILTGDKNRVLRENIYVMNDLSKPYIQCELNVFGKSDYSDSNYKDFDDENYHFLTNSEYAAIYHIYCKNAYPTTWEETDEKEFDDRLNVLPPKRHEQINGVVFFMSSEKMLGNITQTFASFEGKFFKSYQKTNVDYSSLSKDVIEKYYDDLEPANFDKIKNNISSFIKENNLDETNSQKMLKI